MKLVSRYVVLIERAVLAIGITKIDHLLVADLFLVEGVFASA